MLHLDGQPSRTIAFRKTAKGYRWIEEQERWTGPNVYKTVDGTFHEEIFFTYGIEPVSGEVANQLHVEYWGEDRRLPAHQPLTLDRVRSILEEWKSSTRPKK